MYIVLASLEAAKAKDPTAALWVGSNWQPLGLEHQVSVVADDGHHEIHQ